MDEQSTTRARRRRRGNYGAAPSWGSEEKRRSRRRRWPLWLAGYCALLWFAPVIVARSPLPGMALERATADLDARARLERVSLGWFSPVVLEGLELRDAAGGPLVAIERVALEKRLISWLWNRSDLGLIRLQSPQVHVEFAGDTTNLETALAAWLEGEESRPLFESLAAAGLRSFDIEVADGSFELTDLQARRRCEIEDLNASVKLTSLAEGMKAKLRATCVQDRQQSRVEGSLELVPAGKRTTTAVNRAALSSEAFPLWVAGAALRRFATGLELDGQLVSTLDAQWQSDAETLTQAELKADCVVRSLYMTAAALQGDQVRLPEARLPLDVAWRDGRLHITQARLDSEVGNASFSGTLDPTHGWGDALRRNPYQLAGHVDLARLAAMLPRTIHVRDDTRITAGVIDLVLNADAKHEGLVWQGKLETSQLAATSGGQAFTWERPVHLSFQAHETPEALVIDRLYGEADFLELQGEGTVADGHLSATFDLDRLSRELSRFVDLGELRMAGQGTAYMAWQRKERGLFEANSQLEARNFELTYSAQQPWREPQLELTADLTGTMENNSLERIDRATLRMTAAGDLLTARLQQPVVQPLGGGLWAMEVGMRGELARWAPRLRPWMNSVADYQMAGDCDISADLLYGASRLELEPLAATIRELRFSGAGVNINERVVELSASALWDGEDEHIEMSHLRWASPALLAEGKDFVVVLDSERAGELKGNLKYTGDIGQLWHWIEEPGSPSSWQMAGQLNGQLDVRRSGNVVRASLDNTIDRFQARLDGTEAWQEPRLQLTSHVEHDSDAQVVRLTDLNLVGQSLACTAQGQVGLQGERPLAIDGRLRYDLARLQPLWQQWVGTGVKLEGIDERPFSIRGPLGAAAPAGARGTLEPLVDVRRGVTPMPSAPPDEEWLMKMQGNAEVHWTRGDLYGFALGPGDLRGRLLRGVLQFDPIEAVASQGRLRVVPAIRMSPSPMELTMQPGRAADRVQITPQMCDQALKFVAPVLAGVTQAQGQFSVDVDACRLPLTAPSTGDVAGKLRVHSVEVGPGPFVQELAVLMNRAAPARLTKESTVEFRMVNGRVYHKGLELVFPDFTVRTYGSVGLDESLAVMAELPVPPKWIGNNRLGDALKNQTIQLPIGGTLRKPKLDQQALQQTSARFIRDAAAGAVQKELFRQLDRVLGPVTQ